MKKITVLTAVALTLMPMTARAETFTDVIRYTLEHNPELAARQARLRSVSAQQGQAKSGYKPRVELVGDAAAEHREYELTGAANEIHDDEIPYSYGVRAMMNLYEGGKTVYAVRAAKYRENAERSAVSQTAKELISRAAHAYLDYLGAADVQMLQKNNRDVMQAHYIETRDKVSLGKGTSTDTAQAEARLSRAKALLTQADMGVNNAVERFFRITGKKPEYDKALKISAVIAAKPTTQSERDLWSLIKDVPASLDDAERIAEKENPALQELAQRENAAEQNVKIAKNTVSPSLDLSAYAGRQEKQIMLENLTEYQAKLSLTVPLYDGSVSHYKSAEALEQKNAVRSQLDDARAAVREAVRSAWNEIQTRKAEIDYARAQIKASQKALNGVVDEAHNGTRTTLDVLNAQQELLDSKVSLSHAEYSLVKAYFSLLQAMGTLKI